MDFDLTDDERRFRDDLRQWLADHLPPAWRSDHPKEPWTDERRDLARRWQARLAEGRYVALDWPRAWGGRDASLAERIIVQTELIRAHAPRLIGHVGLDLVGPALIEHGSEAQKSRWLEKIRTAEELWCQGFSEPNAGSDLGGLRTRAVLDGDHWVVSGQKVWTSVAEVADWCFLLARTDPDAKKHAGISALLVDMKQPGIDVRPLRQMTGEAEFNEVFFDQVRVPRDHVVGKPGDGWKIAMGILAHERGPMWAFMFHGYMTEDLAQLLELARRRGADRDPSVRQQLAQAHIDLEIMRLLGCRSLTAETRGEPIGPKTSLEKLFGSELSQRVRSLAMEVLGASGLLGLDDERAEWAGRWLRFFLFSRADTIMGGTSEIQRQVIAHQLLGLPR
ncbi:MAG TPA: acyl-CoA dehydrogenase family protein [Candidatus Binatia bacterium]|nr:acyl-CoA dehydrogenase family protein [Candidatus Binatia bacterium]